MKKIYFLVLFIGLSILGAAQADRYWVGPSGANWSAAANWSLTSGGAGGATVPGTLQNAIFDADATVNLDINPSVNSLYIKQGAGGVAITVTFNSTSTRTFTINAGSVPSPAFKVEANCVFNYAAHSSSGSNAFNMVGSGKGEVFGTMNVAGPTPSILPRISFTSANNLTIKAGGKLFFGANSNNPNASGNQSYVMESNAVMEVNRNGFTVPDGTYDANSLFRITGFINSGISSYGGFPNAQLGNIEYDCAGQTALVSLGFPNNYTIKGNLKVLNTNGQKLVLAPIPSGITLNGNLETSALVSIANTGTSITPPTKSLTVNGNLIINPGGVVNLQESSSGGNSYVRLNGNLSIANGGTLTATGNNSTSIHELEFGGATTQTVAVNGTISGIPQLKVNGAGIAVSTNLVLPATNNTRLTLTNGNVDMGANLLHIQNPSTLNGIVGGTISSHVIGRVRRATNSVGSTYVFPVSKSATEIGTVKIYPTGTATDYEVEFFRPNTYPRTGSALPTGVLSASNYYWDISRPAGTAAADVEFVYDGLTNSGGITNPNDVVVLHWNGTSAWDNMGRDNASSTATSVSVLGVNNFSPYALGSTSQVLPVQFVSLSGYFDGRANQLSWQVNGQTNATTYAIERSINGTDFVEIDQVSSPGTTNFKYTDANAQQGNCYYRIKSTDADGKSTLSRVIFIKGDKASQLSIIALVPNPVHSDASLVVNSPTSKTITIEILHASGQLTSRQQQYVTEGNNTIAIPAATLAKGMYFIRVLDNQSDVILQTKMVK